MNSHFNKYWPLLALPVAAAIVALPYLPGPVHSTSANRNNSVQNNSAQNNSTRNNAAAPSTDTAQNAQPQTFGSQTQNDARNQNDAQSSPFNDPNWNPLANDNGANIPDVTSPYAQRAPSGAGDSGSQNPASGNSGQNSAATAALRKVYQASVSSAVRVNVGDSGIGSGFFMSPDGLILTAAHVPLGDSSAKLSVTTGAGQNGATQSLPVTLVGYDEVRDLAVLKAEGSNYPALKLADSTPKVGAGVVAIGNSRGSFDGGRAGAVTALNVSLDPTFPVNMVESSMPLAPGDSGGPVLNAAGEVVGVSTAISNQNGSFASYFVPVTRNSALVQSLVSGVKRGVPVLGIGVADARGATGQPGVLVTAVTPGLGAAKAGLKGGTVREFRDAAGDVQQDISGADIIVGVDGQTVNTPAGLIAYLRGKSVGDRVKLKVQRGGTSGGQTLNVPVVLSAKPVSQG